MNVLGMGPMELLLIIILALIVFGPAKLPEIMGQVGKAINDFRRATSSLSDEFNRTIQAELQEGRSAFDETRAAVSDVRTTVNSAVAGTPAPTRTELPLATTAAPNGVSPDLQAAVSAGPDPYAAGANGAATEAARPPLADTTQWSWETSPTTAATPTGASADAATTDTPLASPAASEAAQQAVQPAAETASESAPPSTPPARPTPPAENPPARAERDDLLPPY